MRSEIRQALRRASAASHPDRAVRPRRSRRGAVRRSALLFAGTAAIVALGACEDQPQAQVRTAAALRWAPPVLTEPTTIDLSTGVSKLALDRDRDYILRMPAEKKVGATWLIGGRNIVIVGGHTTIPRGTPPGRANDGYRRNIYINDATGTVHIEGLLIDGSGGGAADGIDVSAPEATVQIQNVRIVGLRGQHAGFHADVVQPWGGVKDLRIDRLTGSTNYQGLQIVGPGPIGSAEISNVNLFQTAGPYHRGGHMIWLAGEGCASAKITLENVWVKPRRGRWLGDSVWPQDRRTFARRRSCVGRASRTVASWPKLPVTGVVRAGAPPSGDVVPKGSVGIGYPYGAGAQLGP